MNNFIHTKLQDKRKAKSYTAIVMIFFLTLLLLPLFSYQDPPPGQPGLLVSFGDPTAGQGDEAPSAPQEKPAEEKPNPSKPKKETPKKTVKEKTKPKEKPKEVKTPIDEKVIAAKNEAIALQKQEAKEKADKKSREIAKAKAESDKKAQELAAHREAEKARKEKEKAQELAEAAKAAEAAKKAQETSDFKNALTDAFGKGKGNGGKPGNQGVPNGDPNADALKGLSTGSGKIGGGLSNRGGAGPSISDNSNKTGTVVVKVCINSSGAVQSVGFTQKGSTTQDAELIKLAVDNARKWSFKSGIQDETCGTITYDFKVK